MVQLVRVAATAGVIAATGFLSFSLAAAPTPMPDPLASLTGRWVGNAVMTTLAGPVHNFKCIVTYLPRKDGPGVQQNLRCSDESDFKLHAATDLQVDGGKVTGRWQDKINEIYGTVAGDVTPTGFEVQLDGTYFQAKMAVAGQGCDQSVKVMPQNSSIFRELAATLKKC